MNLPELLIVIIIISGGYFGGKFLGFYFGITGWIIGLILGCILVVIAYVLFLRFIDLLEYYFPSRPKCKNPECKSNSNYVFVEMVLDGVILRCTCGARYYSTGRRFMEVLENGEYRAYMKKDLLSLSWKKEIPKVCK
ncbi:MAG: hypothetical protein HPY51_21195 [Candidatus Omnitrophica bacterium]|nr:hypothetical protein [Candidatus Omnitrophota bacterium]